MISAMLLILAQPYNLNQGLPTVRMPDGGTDIRVNVDGMQCVHTINVSGGGGGGSLPDAGWLLWDDNADVPNRRKFVSGNYTSINNATANETKLDWAHGLTCSAGQALVSSGVGAMTCTSTLTASDLACSGTCVSDSEIVGIAGAKVSGAVALATTATSATTATTATSATTAGALTSNPTDCSVGQHATAIDAQGNLTCSAVISSSLSGTISNGQLASTYSGVGVCAAGTWASTLNGNSAPTCTQPAFSNLSGTVTNAQLANSYSGVGVCGANTWASTLNGNASPTCTQPSFSSLSGTPTIAQGGTGVTSRVVNDVVIGTGANTTATKVLPSCSAAGQKLLFDNTTQTFSCGTDQNSGGTVTGVTASAPLASSGGAAPNITLTGVITAANGGLGVAQPTCSAGQFLTCNGATCSCSTPAGGGGGSANVLEASLVLEEAGFYSVSVAAAWVTAGSKIVCAPFGTTSDGLTPEAITIGQLSVSVSSLVSTVGFNLQVYSPNGLSGTVRFHCTGV